MKARDSGSGKKLQAAGEWEVVQDVDVVFNCISTSTDCSTGELPCSPWTARLMFPIAGRF